MRSLLHSIPGLLVLALAGSAGAAGVEVNQLTSTLSRTVLGAKDCGSNYNFDLTAKLNGTPVLDLGDAWTLAVATSSSCSGGTTLSKSPTQVSSDGLYRATFTGRELFRAATGTECPGVDEVKTVYVCATWENSDETTQKTSAKLEIDTQGPSVPKLTSVKPGDSSLHLDFKPAASASSPSQWEVCYQVSETQDSGLQAVFGMEDGGAGGDEGELDPGAGGSGGDDEGELDPDDGGISDDDELDPGAGGAGGAGGSVGDGGTGGDGGDGGSDGTGGTGGSGDVEEQEFTADSCASRFSGTKRSYRLEGLRNGTTYRVAIRAIDDKGNESEFSDPVEGTPIPVDDFWDRYKAAGGGQQGCGSGPGAAGVVAFFVVFISFAAARRRKAR